MSRRIEIELTSARPDGSWTWRAAGAREPKGVVQGSLLPAEAKAGDVLKAEADFELEGINIISVTAPKADARPQPARIEVVGPARSDTPGVTTQLVGRSERRPSDRRRDRVGDDARTPRHDRTPGRPQPGRPPRQGAATDSEAAPRRGAGSEPGSPDRSRTDRRPGRGETPGGGAPRPRRPEQAEGGPDRARRPAGRAPSSEGAEAAAERAKTRRFSPGTAHRQAVMDSLPPEQRPIAEQVLRGGIPAVRTALHLEREKAEGEGRAAPNTDELIAMAEALLPRLRAAEWRDRAEAAAADADAISLRDLRSVVAGGDQARDDETRALAATLREVLEGRVARLHQEWAAEIAKHLDEKRVIRAVRLTSRPPEPSARLDAELLARVATAAGEAMAPDTSPDLWAAMLDAVAASPVRRSVQPAGLPENAPPELKRAAHQQSGTVPALAKLLGVSIPPPPLPSPARRRPDGGEGPNRSRNRARPGRASGEGGRPRKADEPGQSGTEKSDVGQPSLETPVAGASETATGGGEAGRVPTELSLAPEPSALPAASEYSALPSAPVQGALSAAPEHAALAAAPVQPALAAPVPVPQLESPAIDAPADEDSTAEAVNEDRDSYESPSPEHEVS